MKTIIAIAATVLLCGCVSMPERMAATPSGRPEVLIAATTSAIKSAIIARHVSAGYVVESESEHALQISRPANVGESIQTSLALGNSYGTNAKVIQFAILRNASGARVIASVFYRAQLPGGRTNQMVADKDNRVFNLAMQDLLAVKAELEPRG